MNIVDCSSYAELLQSLLEYHKKIVCEARARFKFPTVSSVPFIALRKNVELGFLRSSLVDWEQEAISQYGKKPILEEYYPLILDFVKKTTIPQKCQDYACSISYSYIFPPVYHKNIIGSFFINFFEKPIFKKFNAQHGELEQKIVAKISAFFRKQNKYGPEQIAVSILDDTFMTIFISGLLSPFLKEFIKDNAADAAVIEKIFTTQVKTLLEEIFDVYFTTILYKPFIFFDKDNDKLIVLSSLRESVWKCFFETMDV